MAVSISMIFRHCAGNQVAVFLFLLGEDRYSSNSGFWDEIRVQSLVCVILIVFRLMYCFLTPVSVAARSKAYVFGRSPVEIVGSNPTGGMDVCLL